MKSRILLLFCVAVCSFQMSFSQCAVTATLSGSGEICGDGTDNALIQLGFTPGSPPYSFTVTNTSTGTTYSDISNFSSWPLEVSEVGLYEITGFNSAASCGDISTDNNSAIISSYAIADASISSLSDFDYCANTAQEANLLIDFDASNQRPFSIAITDNSGSYVITSNFNPVEIPFTDHGTFSIDSIWDDHCKGTIESSNTASFTISEITPTIPSLNQSDMTICEGETITLTASNTGDSIDGWVRDGVTLLPGTDSVAYSFTASRNDVVLSIQIEDEICGTVTSEAVNILVTTLPDVDAGEDINMNIEETSSIDGYADPEASITWSPTDLLTNIGTATPTISTVGMNIGGTTVYTITALKDNCSNTDSLIVTINRDLIIYNSFSPNGDGVNDTWKIEGLEQYDSPEVRIMNRWGGIVYQSTEYSNYPWDGLVNGEHVPSGTYYYILTTKSTELPTQTGSVTIVR